MLFGCSDGHACKFFPLGGRQRQRWRASMADRIGFNLGLREPCPTVAALNPQPHAGGRPRQQPGCGFPGPSVAATFPAHEGEPIRIGCPLNPPDRGARLRVLDCEASRAKMAETFQPLDQRNRPALERYELQQNRQHIGFATEIWRWIEAADFLTGHARA